MGISPYPAALPRKIGPGLLLAPSPAAPAYDTPLPNGDETEVLERFMRRELAPAGTGEFTQALLAAAIPPGGIEPPLRA